jgi:hypothetical protein
MRFIMKVKMPVEAGNAAAKSGFHALQAALADIKPEAAYFYTEDGRRTGLLIVNMSDVSQIPALAEPFFLSMNASVEMYPAMTPEDLMKAGPSIEAAVKKYS